MKQVFLVRRLNDQSLIAILEKKSEAEKYKDSHWMSDQLTVEPWQLIQKETSPGLGAEPPPGRRWTIGRTVYEINVINQAHNEHSDTEGCPVCDDVHNRGAFA